ncbi:MAG TPA: TIGR02444 family protein [Pseudolabrys sp.]
MPSPFWDFSIAVYGTDAVADECLALQDEFGLDVNLLLLCAFVGARHGVALTADDIVSVRAEVEPWHKGIVSTLRDARRALKPVGSRDTDAGKAAAELRTRVKAAELESERIEQAMLEQWAGSRLASRQRGEPATAVPANLQALLAAYGIAPERVTAVYALRHLIAAALARAN